MISTNYNDLPNQLCSNNCSVLVGAIFKILPMKEEQSPTWDEYVRALLMELTGAHSLMKNIDYNGEYLSIISNLEYLLTHECSVEICKKRVFHCINLIKKIDTLYFREEG